jgi:hypothetical protein
MVSQSRVPATTQLFKRMQNSPSKLKISDGEYTIYCSTADIVGLLGVVWKRVGFRYNFEALGPTIGPTLGDDRYLTTAVR